MQLSLSELSRDHGRPAAVSGSGRSRPRVIREHSRNREVVCLRDSNYESDMSRRVVALFFASAAAVSVTASLGASLSGAAAAPVVPLTVVPAHTPLLPVRGYDTSGSYPQVRGEAGLKTVDAALRRELLTDQRRYASEAGKDQQGRPPNSRGVYSTAIDRRYLSASSVVVSALLPATREAFPGQHGGDGWLGMTVQAPSGRVVAITDLFANPSRGIRALAAAWKARIRQTSARPCLRVYAVAYTATAEHYRAFALTHDGIAVGSAEIEACYRLVATVRYAALHRYFSRLGSKLIAGVREARV